MDKILLGATTRVGTDLGATVMKGNSPLPKAPVLLQPHNRIIGSVLTPCRDAVGVFSSLSRLGENRNGTKTNLWRSQAKNKEIVLKKPRTWLRKGKLKKQNESLLKAAQINTIRTYYLKAEIENMQQNMKCIL